MFDSPVPFRLVQIQKNKHSNESFVKQFIYTFIIKDKYRSIKYVVCVKEYAGNLLTIDFYPKINATDKYKVLTHQFRYGSIGATIFKIMADIQERIGLSCFGILSASMINESDNLGNKRYSAYIKILQRKMNADNFLVAGVRKNSYIFITPINYSVNNNVIYLQYDEIFKETS